MTSKICSRCKLDKPLDDFHRYKRKLKTGVVIGKKSACKICLNSSRRDYYNKNKEIVLLRMKKYNQKPEIIERNKEYYRQNRERIRDRVKKWKENNKGKAVESQKKYYEKKKQCESIDNLFK